MKAQTVEQAPYHTKKEPKRLERLQSPKKRLHRLPKRNYEGYNHLKKVVSITCSIPQTQVNRVTVDHYICTEIIKYGRDIILHHKDKAA